MCSSSGLNTNCSSRKLVGETCRSSMRSREYIRFQDEVITKVAFSKDGVRIWMHQSGSGKGSGTLSLHVPPIKPETMPRRVRSWCFVQKKPSNAAPNQRLHRFDISLLWIQWVPPWALEDVVCTTWKQNKLWVVPGKRSRSVPDK